MAGSRFRLEAVRRVREARRDELRGQLADAYLAADRLAEQRRLVEQELTAARQRMTDAAGAREFSVNAMLAAQRHELILRNQLKDLDSKAQLIEHEAEKRRLAVVAAEQQVRAVDTLEQRDQERRRAEEKRLEDKSLDEAAGVAWLAAVRGGGG